MTTLSPGAAFTQGALMMAGLIVAIGAQNALVLRQGLLRRHVGPVVLFCMLSDALLTATGVYGFGAWIAGCDPLLRMLGGAGALFLLGCGLHAARRAWHGGRGLEGAPADAGSPAPATLRRTLATVAALTWLNPHVYLDTVVLVGTVGAQHAAAQRAGFAAGAVLASCVWFTALGFGAAALAPRLAHPATWRIIDATVALVMLAVALPMAAMALRPRPV